MRYVPRKAREDVNLSDTHPLAEAALLISAVTAFFVLVAVLLIFFVELIILFVSEETEVRLFESFVPADIVAAEAEDSRLAAARSILDRLRVHWPESPYPHRLEISADGMPNAMAFPGGLIVVTSGLLDRVESENELAFVLGHELGHYRNRDHMRMLGRGVLVGIAFGALMGGDGYGLTIADLTLRGFSREQESDADEFGLGLVQAEYGHVADSWRFFERLTEEGLSESELASYLSTHPSADERIDDLKDLARRRGWALQGPATELDW